MTSSRCMHLPATMSMPQAVALHMLCNAKSRSVNTPVWTKLTCAALLTVSHTKLSCLQQSDEAYLDNDVGHIHALAEGWKPDNKLNGVHIMRNDDQSSLFLLHQGCDVVQAVLHHHWLLLCLCLQALVRRRHITMLCPEHALADRSSIILEL